MLPAPWTTSPGRNERVVARAPLLWLASGWPFLALLSWHLQSFRHFGRLGHFSGFWQPQSAWPSL